jgi:ribulose 1,5-bisphosphate synthetase/thiazole synthase
MATYSFLDVTAAITGAGGSFNLASGAGAAEEGITVAAVEDKNTMMVGAGGQGMHSLIASEARLVTVRLLKTSPVNAQLQNMYNFQTLSSVLHGKNVITIRDIARGDAIIFTQVAFKRMPDINYAKEGGTVEWTFDAISSSTVLGVGTPEV